jgi:hypothetical protein
MKFKNALMLSALTLAPLPAMAFAPAPSTPEQPTVPTPPSTPSVPSTPAKPDVVYDQRVRDIAAASACAKYSWADRGRAPAGYIKGMALSFARSVCRLHANDASRSPATLMSRADTEDATKDVFSHYKSTFDARGMSTDRDGVDSLRALYALGIGLGMRESSGKYCEGYDKSAGTETASEAEAGTFQFSYNSIGASSELRKLYDEYRNGSAGRCNLEVFKEGVSCKSQSIVGSGAGADFQAFVKSCPGFGAEYAMTTLRVIRKHYGPINRKEAELNADCGKMLEDVQSLIEEDIEGACSDIN